MDNSRSLILDSLNYLFRGVTKYVYSDTLYDVQVFVAIYVCHVQAVSLFDNQIGVLSEYRG